MNNINGKGTNRLIKEGIAKLVTCPNDIIEELEKSKEISEKTKLKQNNKNMLSIIQIKKYKIKKQKRYKKQINIPEVIKEKEYQEIYKIILKNPNNIDIIYEKSKNSIGEINQILLMLEIEGYIKKTAGGYECIQKKN